MRGLALCFSEPEMTGAPTAEARQVQATHDETVDMFQHQNLGEQQLFFRPDFQLFHGLIGDRHEFIACKLLLELLDPLEEELFILLAEGKPLRLSGARSEFLQHGSTLTTTTATFASRRPERTRRIRALRSARAPREDMPPSWGRPSGDVNGRERHYSRAIGPEHASVVEVHVFHLSLGALGVHVEQDANASRKATRHIHLGRAEQCRIRPAHLARSPGRVFAGQILSHGKDDAGHVIDIERVGIHDGLEELTRGPEHCRRGIFRYRRRSPYASCRHDSMNSRPELRLLAIAGPPLLDPARMVDACRAAEQGGVTAVQVRWKNAPVGDLVQVTTEVVQALSIPVFVNDRADVAWAAGAHGVHLGADDLPIDRVRRASPSPWCIGTSVGDVDEATAARATGADYWGIGPVCSTSTKGDAGPAIGTVGFRRLADMAPPGTAVIAIGGIDADAARSVMEAGADGIAVSRAVFGSVDVARAASRLRVIVAP